MLALALLVHDVVQISVDAAVVESVRFAGAAHGLAEDLDEGTVVH
jgi:hypothetical protein